MQLSDNEAMDEQLSAGGDDTGGAPPEPERGRLSHRARAWIGLGALVVALTLLTMLSQPEGIDPDATPPAADGGAAAESEGGAVAGKPANLGFTLKDLNG